MSSSKSIIFKYTYATSALKQNTVTVFGETATAFVAGQDYDENVIFRIPAASLSAFILYYNGVVPNGTVGSSATPSLRTENGAVTNIPAYSPTAQYFLGNVVTFTPANSTNTSCYTLIRTSSVLSDPVPTQGTTVVGYTGPVIGQNQYYQSFMQGLSPIDSTGVAHKSYWAQSTIAAGWTATVPYYTGDRVVYQGNVYQCITTNGLIDTTVKLLSAFGKGDGVSSYYGYDEGGIRYVLNVLPSNSNFWLYSSLPAVPTSSYTYMNWAQSDIGGLNTVDGSGGVVMKWDGTRPADLLPTATSGGILGGSGTVTFLTFVDDELNKVSTLLNLYNQNQNSFSLVNANAILAKLPASVIKSQTSSASLEPDQQLAQLLNAGPRYTNPSAYNTVVQSIFEEAIANDMLYTTNSDGTRTKLNQLAIHGYPTLLSGLETVKPGSTTAFAQGKASMGVYGVSIVTAGTGYTNGTYQLVFAAPDTTGITATGTVTISGGFATTVSITNTGSGYTTTIPAPTLPTTLTTSGTATVFGLPTMSLVGVAMTSYGGYYSSNQAVTVALQNPLSMSSGVCSAFAPAYTVVSGTTPTMQTTLNSFNLVSPGSGYTSVPNVIVSGSTKLGGSLPTFTPLMGVNQIATRTGYTGIPVTRLPMRVAISAPTSGVTATANPVLYGTVSSIPVTSAGSGYLLSDKVTISAPYNGVAPVSSSTILNGVVNTASLSAYGSGFYTTPNVVVSPPTVTAVANASIFGGYVSALTVTTPGTGYLNAPYINIAAPPTAVTAIGVPVINSVTGGVTGVTMINAGVGYVTAPSITFSAGSATAVANIENGSITGITVTNAGTGYSRATPPTVVFGAPPQAIQAQAVATVSNTGAITGMALVNTVVGLTVGGTNTGYSAGSPPTVTISAPATATVTATAVSAGVTTLTLSTIVGTLLAGQSITISGSTKAGNNGTFTILSILDATRITFNNPTGLSNDSTGSLVMGVRALGSVVLNTAGTSIASVRITNPGAGYTSAPTVTVSSGNATVTAVIGTGGIGYLSIPSVGVLGATSFNVVSLVTGTTSPFAFTTTRATMLANINNDAIGSVGSLSIINGGSGYTADPTVTFIASAGSTAQASLSINASGGINGIVMINGGYGYGLATTGGASEPITVSIVSSGGSGAVIGTPVVTYTLDRFVYTNKGSGYTTPPTCTITNYTGGGTYTDTALSLVPNLSVVSIPTYIGVTNLTATGGVGYSQADAVNITNNANNYLTLSFSVSPTSYTAAAYAVMGGVIQSVTISTPGTGYVVGTNVTFSAPASGQGAPAAGYIGSVNNSTGAITSVTLTSGGYGYGFVSTGGAYAAEVITVTVSGSGTGGVLTVGSTPASIYYNVIGFAFQGNSYGQYVTAPSVSIAASAITTTTGSSPSFVALASVVATLGVVPSPTALNASAGIGLYASPQLVFDDPPQGMTAIANAVVVNNTVNNIVLTNSGFGYDFVPTVSISGYGTGATANAIMGVTQVFIVSGGGGYAVGNVITLTAPSSGVTAVVTVTQVDVYGKILNTYISNSGSGYTSMPTLATVVVSATNSATVTPSKVASLQFYLGVTSVTIVSNGTAYAGVPAVVFQSPAFTSSVASATSKTARIQTLKIVSGGSGYTQFQKCKLLGGATHLTSVTEDYGYVLVTGVSSGAITSCTIGGTIGTVTVANGGSGYSSSSPPNVQFSGGNASLQATATTVVNSLGVVTGIAFDPNPGSYGTGYTGIPTVTIDPPSSGVRATAVATLDGGFDYRAGDILTIQGGVGGSVSVTTVSSSIADANDVALTSYGSGYVSVPNITSYGGAQGIVLATSLKLYGVQIPSYVNNGLYNNGDGVYANIAGSGVIQVGTLNVSGSIINGVTLTNPVSNLSSYPTIIINGSGTGSGLSAVATSAISTSAGTCGTVTGVTITNAGGYYSSATPPTVTFSSPPSAVQAVGTASVSSGNVSVAVSTAGSGYASAPTVSIVAALNDSGTGAVAVATLSATGSISAITMTNSGTGYLTAPTVIITAPPPSSTAQGVTTVTGSGATGRVTAVTVTYAGSGYTSAPSVTFAAPSLGSIVAYANCGLGSVQITSSVAGFAGNATVYTSAPSGPLTSPTQALIVPLKFREITAITGLTNLGVVGATGYSPLSTYIYASGKFPLVAISAPALSTTATEGGNDATQLITNEVSNGFTFTTPQFAGWYGVNFNVGDTFQFIVKYTVAKAVIFAVDTDVTIPGITSASSSITIGGVTIPLYNPATGTGVGRELSTNALVHTYMITLKAS